MSSLSIAIDSEESTFNSSHPQKNSQPAAQSSFSCKTSSTIISDSPSNENAEQSVQQSHIVTSLPQRAVKSSNSRNAFCSTPNSTTRLHASNGTLSPQAQLTLNTAHQPQSYVKAQPYDSSTVTGATSSVFHSAISTLLDVDTFGDERMESDDFDSNYSSFESSSLAQQMPYTTPPSALNRSYSLPPQFQGRYGLSSRYNSSSDYVSVYARVWTVLCPVLSF